MGGFHGSLLYGPWAMRIYARSQVPVAAEPLFL